MSEMCGDNRFELIGKFKGELIEGTNIEASPDEMAVLDNILFRIWQMGWLDKLKAQEPRLMTFDELSAISRTDSIVYVERRTKTYYNEMAFVAVEKVYGDTVSFNGQKSNFGHSKKDYGKEWRCWTSRPSDEQMKEAKWE